MAKLQTFGWVGIFFAIFLSGIFTSFTPCVFPVVPMTLAVIGHGTEGKSRIQGFFVSFVYVTGIAIVYSTLGLIVASSGAVFGSYLGHPLVNAGIAFIFFIMAASMFGAFDLEAPRFIRNRFRMVGTGKGYGGAFGAGLVAGIIASPCVGPVLVAILAFVAQTQDMLLGFAL
ncbi:MAG: cytochrome c biogenesis protein CcdA [Bdellovibrionales bacterium]